MVELEIDVEVLDFEVRKRLDFWRPTNYFVRSQNVWLIATGVHRNGHYKKIWGVVKVSTKKYVTRNRATEPENLELLESIKKMRAAYPGTYKEFYRSIGISQQTWDNWEKKKGPIPAWALLRAVRQHRDKKIIGWWTNLSLESPLTEASVDTKDPQAVRANKVRELQDQLLIVNETLRQLIEEGEGETKGHDGGSTDASRQQAHRGSGSKPDKTRPE